MTYATYDDVEAGRLAGMHMPLTTARSAHAPRPPPREHDGRRGNAVRLGGHLRVDSGHSGWSPRATGAILESPSEHTTHIPEIRRLQRSRRSDRMLAGVSGAWLAASRSIPQSSASASSSSPSWARAGILIYAAAALVIPDEGKEDSSPGGFRNRRDRPWPLIGLGLLAVAGAILLSRATLWPDGDSWWLFLIAGGVILWLTRTPGAATDATELAARDSRRVRRALGTFAIVVASLVTLALVAAAIFLAVFDVDGSIGDRRPRSLRRTPRRLPARDRLHDARPQRPLAAGGRDARRRESRCRRPGRVIVPADDVALRIHGTAEVGEVDLPDGLAPTGATPSDLTETGLACSCSTRMSAPGPGVERAVR